MLLLLAVKHNHKTGYIQNLTEEKEATEQPHYHHRVLNLPEQYSDSSSTYLFLFVPTTVLSPGICTHLVQKTAGCTGDLPVEHWPQKNRGKGVKVTVLKTKLSFGFPHLLKLTLTFQKDRKFTYFAHFPLFLYFLFFEQLGIFASKMDVRDFFVLDAYTRLEITIWLLRSTDYPYL